jgi:hypothetical protein
LDRGDTSAASCASHRDLGWEPAPNRPLPVIQNPDYVPVDKFTALAEFDGGVVERNACEVSARCHDEQASFLALNRMRGIVTTGMRF